MTDFSDHHTYKQLPQKKFPLGQESPLRMKNKVVPLFAGSLFLSEKKNHPHPFKALQYQNKMFQPVTDPQQEGLYQPWRFLHFLAGKEIRAPQLS